jgi:hypothetical protein
MNSDQIRNWLLKHPRPHTVKVIDEHGGEHVVQCGQASWARCADSIIALRPDLLQAMTPDGQIIRACRPNDVAEDWVAEDDPEGAPAPRRAPPPPLQIPLTGLDPESARFSLFAQLLAEAYKHSTDVAFARLADIVEGQNRRAENVERTREAMYRTHVKQLEAALKEAGQDVPEAPNGELLQQMLGGLLQGVMMGKGAPPGVVPNGKDHA